MNKSVFWFNCLDYEIGSKVPLVFDENGKHNAHINMETTAYTSEYNASLFNNSTVTDGDNSTTFLAPGFLAVTTIAYGVIFFFGVTGNALVAIVIWRNTDMRSSTNYFLVNLSIADLMIILVCLPSSLLELYVPAEWILGEFMCKYTLKSGLLFFE